VLFIAVLGFFLYAIRPVIQAWLMEVTPTGMAGSSVGVLFGTQSLGSSAGPLLAGMIADRHGLGAVFYMLAATIVCANLMILLMPRETRPSPVLHANNGSV
jgi:FSR family fosmidomycin resistance protein-like MFS transporter